MSTYKKQPIPKDLRLAVFKRDGFQCRYCGVTGVSFHADHVFPESRGGVTTIENLVTACPKCNHAKHAIIGIWPKPIGYFSDDISKLIKRETLQKNIASGYRAKYKELASKNKYAWMFVAKYAYTPMVFAYGFSLYNLWAFDGGSPIETFRDLIIFCLGLSVGLLYAAFVYWRKTK